MLCPRTFVWVWWGIRINQHSRDGMCDHAITTCAHGSQATHQKWRSYRHARRWVDGKEGDVCSFGMGSAGKEETDEGRIAPKGGVGQNRAPKAVDGVGVGSSLHEGREYLLVASPRCDVQRRPPGAHVGSACLRPMHEKAHHEAHFAFPRRCANNTNVNAPHHHRVGGCDGVNAREKASSALMQHEGRGWSKSTKVKRWKTCARGWGIDVYP